MASTRMTNDLRDAIRSRVLDYKFKDVKAALVKREAALFDELIDLALGEHKAAVETLPEGFLPTTMSLSVEYPTTRVGHGRTRYRDTAISGAHPRRVAAEWSMGAYGSTTARVITAAGVRKAQEFLVARSETNEAANALDTKMKGLLSNVTTVDKLYELWPELESIVPKTSVQPSQAPSNRAMATRVEELNAAIPLPPPKAAKKAQTVKKRPAKKKAAA